MKSEKSKKKGNSLKVYSAPTRNEAIMKAKIDLGEEIDIIEEKTEVKSNFWDAILGRKPSSIVKVVVKKKKKKKKSVIKKPSIITENGVNQYNANPSPVNNIVRIDSKYVDSTPFLSGGMSEHIIEPKKSNSTLSDRVDFSKGGDNVENLLVYLTEQVVEMGRELKELKSGEKKLMPLSPSYHPNVEKIKKLFNKNELETSISEEIITYLSSLSTEILEDYDGIKERVVNYLSKKIQVGGTIDNFERKLSNHPKIISFVGPTGVGKTTTIAKIAADFQIKDNKKVAFVTLDTYRVGAIEQFRVYADVIGIPMSTVFKIDEFGEILEQFNDKDIILVDTAGRCQKSCIEMAELKNFLSEVENINTYLVLSSTMRYSEMNSIINNFESIGMDGVILTKFDDTTVYGPIVNISSLSGKKVAYIANGQNVPDDYRVANSVEIARYLVENE